MADAFLSNMSVYFLDCRELDHPTSRFAAPHARTHMEGQHWLPRRGSPDAQTGPGRLGVDSR
jgi:hypothetical protein